MEGWVVVFDHCKQSSYCDFGIQLLFDLTLKGLLRSFSGLNFSARNLPAIFEFAVTTLCGKDTISILNNCSYYINYVPHSYHSMWLYAPSKTSSFFISIDANIIFAAYILYKYSKKNGICIG